MFPLDHFEPICSLSRVVVAFFSLITCENILSSSPSNHNVPFSVVSELGARLPNVTSGGAQIQKRHFMTLLRYACEYAWESTSWECQFSFVADVDIQEVTNVNAKISFACLTVQWAPCDVTKGTATSPVAVVNKALEWADFRRLKIDFLFDN